MTRSGSKDFHGSAAYYKRDQALNGNEFLRRQQGLDKPGYKFDNEAWTIGGPVLKNKLFFFFAYEQWNNTQPSVTIRTLPTDLERAGDFSQSLNINGGLRAIYDPTTTVFDPASNTSTRQPFPGNKIPADRLYCTVSRCPSRRVTRATMASPMPSPLFRSRSGLAIW